MTIFLIATAILAVLLLGVVLFMQTAVFGANPSGARLQRIEKSANYQNGAFGNLEPTEVMLPESNYFQVFLDFLNKSKDNEPKQILPSVKTNLNLLTGETPEIVWFGHSSYFIRSQAFTVLVDPVFSGYASPIPLFGKAFSGADAYVPDDFPEIDLLVLTHDHYDHLDYETLLKLAPKIKKICTSLGVGAHLERWGFASDKIIELNWWEQANIAENIDMTAVPARHFSGRGFVRGKSLWSGFALKIHGFSLFLGGDSGYGKHFQEIGEKCGPFDIAMLEAGQYGVNWPLIHMKPEETVQAAKDIRARVLFPVHWAKFALAYHAWYEPIERVTIAAQNQKVPVTTPKIGEVVRLGSHLPSSQWWRKLQ